MTEISMFPGAGQTVFDPSQDLKSLGVWECKHNSFTAVFPTGKEPPANLVEECRKADPDFVVVWNRKVYETPSHGTEEFGHYVICREVPTTEVKGEWDSKLPIKLDAWPKNWPHDPRAIYEVRSWTIPMPKGSPLIALGLPDIPKDFDQNLVEYVKQEAYAYANWTQDQWNQWSRSKDELDRKELERLISEIQYQVKTDYNMVKPDEGIEYKEWTSSPFVEVKGVSE